MTKRWLANEFCDFTAFFQLFRLDGDWTGENTTTKSTELEVSLGLAGFFVVDKMILINEITCSNEQ